MHQNMKDRGQPKKAGRGIHLDAHIESKEFGHRPFPFGSPIGETQKVSPKLLAQRISRRWEQSAWRPRMHPLLPAPLSVSGEAQATGHCPTYGPVQRFASIQQRPAC